MYVWNIVTLNLEALEQDQVILLQRVVSLLYHSCHSGRLSATIGSSICTPFLRLCLLLGWTGSGYGQKGLLKEREEWRESARTNNGDGDVSLEGGQKERKRERERWSYKYTKTHFVPHLHNQFDQLFGILPNKVSRLYTGVTGWRKPHY